MPVFFKSIVGILLLSVCMTHGGAALADEPLRRGNGPEPDSMDPQLAQGLSAHNVLRDLYEGLVAGAADGSVKPAAAVSWSVDEGGKRYRFVLREDGRWSNGEPVTASDFVYAFRRAANPATGSSYAHLLSVIEGFETPQTEAFGVTSPSPLALEIRLKQATPHFLHLLTLPVAFPLYAPALQAHGVRFTRPGNVVSNGPYELTYWRVNERMELGTNPHYRSPPPLSTVHYFHFDDPDTELKRFRAGDLDVTEALPPGRYQWAKQHLAAELRAAPYLGTFFLGFNMTRPPFADNPDLRAALSYAVDRERIVNAVLKSGEVPALGVIPPGTAGYTADHLPLHGQTQQAREALARAHYQKAGYGPDKPLEVEIRFNTSPLHQRTLLAVAAMWKQVLGVQASLVNEEWKVFVSNRRLRAETEVFRWGWIGDFNDPVSFLDLFRSGQALNNAGFTDPAFDALLEQAGTQTGSERLTTLLQAEQRLMDAHAILPLYGYVSKHLVSTRVAGWEDHLLDRHPSADLRWQ